MDIWKINEKEYITAASLAEVCKVSRQTVYRWVYLGMPAYRSPAGSFLIPLEEALKWVEEFRR